MSSLKVTVWTWDHGLTELLVTSHSCNHSLNLMLIEVNGNQQPLALKWKLFQSKTKTGPETRLYDVKGWSEVSRLDGQSVARINGATTHDDTSLKENPMMTPPWRKMHPLSNNDINVLDPTANNSGHPSCFHKSFYFWCIASNDWTDPSHLLEGKCIHRHQMTSMCHCQ